MLTHHLNNNDTKTLLPKQESMKMFMGQEKMGKAITVCR